MIVLKYRQPKLTYRETFYEWVLSFGLLSWGIGLLLVPDLFYSNSFYVNLLSISPQWLWALGSIIVAFIRLLGLSVINRWRFSPHMRAITATMSSLMWGGLLTIAIMQAPFRAPSIAILGIPLIMEFFSIWWSAGDAKYLDSKANEQEK